MLINEAENVINGQFYQKKKKKKKKKSRKYAIFKNPVANYECFIERYLLLFLLNVSDMKMILLKKQ